MRYLFLAASGLGLLLAVGGPGVSAGSDLAADESSLRAAGVPTEGPGLLDYVRNQTADEARVKLLIKQLGDDSYTVRERASQQLIDIGPRARRYLLDALKGPDPERVRRAKECLEWVNSGASGVVLCSAIRVIAARRPAGSVEVLLNFLPSADDDYVLEEARAALGELAVHDGKVDPALLKALTDEGPRKRGAAGVAIARARIAEHLPAVRKLLDDPDLHNRMYVGLALTQGRDKDAVAALIRLLDQMPPEDTGLIEDLLLRLAGDKGPSVVPGADAASRRRYREAWEKWWKDNQAGIDAAALEQATRVKGHTLVVLLDDNEIVDLDQANRPRWRITGLQKPLDVQLLPGEERVLIAEHGEPPAIPGRVTERDTKGVIKWEKRIDGPLMAQRLPNGNTFIMTSMELVEVDHEGKVLFTYTRPDGFQFMKGQKLRNGDVMCVLTLGLPARCVRLTPDGSGSFKDATRGFPVDVRTSGGRLDTLPNGNVLVAELENNVVREIAPDGTEVHRLTVVRPVAAVRLPNGHTLATSMDQHRAIELDRTGKEVWQFQSVRRVTRALRH
jgi:hypothetical protein